MVGPVGTGHSGGVGESSWRGLARSQLHLTQGQAAPVSAFSLPFAWADGEGGVMWSIKHVQPSFADLGSIPAPTVTVAVTHEQTFSAPHISQMKMRGEILLHEVVGSLIK